MVMVADAAGMTLTGLRRTFASEEALLGGFAGWADAAMLDHVAGQPRPATHRARIIGGMLARFHILLPRREAVQSILAGAASDPASLMFFARVSAEEHRWTLIAAGLCHRGARVRNLAEAIAQAFVAAAPVWLDDADPELTPTRAAIDAALAFDGAFLATFAMKQDGYTAAPGAGA